MATGSYDPTLSTPKDELRFLIGDTVDPYYFSDEELNALLAKTNNNVYQAALLAASAGMARERGSASSRSIGPMSISDDGFTRWKQVYDQLVTAGPSGGGSSASGLLAMPAGYGYQTAREVFADARPLHARVGIHDEGGEDSDYDTGEA